MPARMWWTGRGQRVVGRGGAGGAAQQHDGLAYLRTFEEALGAAQHVGDAGLGERLLVRLRLGVDPEQHGDLAGRHAAVEQLLDRPATPAASAGSSSYSAKTGSGPSGRWATSASRCGDRALAMHPVGQVDDLGGGPVVANQLDHGGRRDARRRSRSGSAASRR